MFPLVKKKKKPLQFAVVVAAEPDKASEVARSCVLYFNNAWDYRHWANITRISKEMSLPHAVRVFLAIVVVVVV